MKPLFNAFIRLALALALVLVAAPTPARAAPGGVITLWHPFDSGSADEAALLSIIANAEAAYAGLDIQPESHVFSSIYDDYTTAFSAGGGPDLWIAPNDSLGDFSRAGSLVDITSEVSLGSDLANVRAGAIDGMKVGDSLYGIPQSFSALALFYNKSAVATPPADTAALLDMVQNQGKTFASEGGPYYFYPYWAAFGGQAMDSETGECIATVNSGVADAMQYLLNLQTAGGNVMAGHEQARDGFLDGTYDMVVGGPWMISTFSALGANMGVAVLPDGPSSTEAAPLVGTSGFYFNPNSAVPLADLVDLALYMTNTASSQIWMDTARHTPVRTDITVTDPVVQAFTTAADQGQIRPQFTQLGNYWGPFWEMSLDVLSDDIPPAVAVRRACNTMNVYNNFPADATTHVLWYSYAGGSGEESALRQVVDNVHAGDNTLTIVPVFVPFGSIFNDYQQAVLDGAGPDWLLAPNDSLGSHVRAGVALNISSYVTPATDFANVSLTAVNGMKVGGNLYGIPESAKALALFYNKNQVTTPPATTAELLDMVQNQGKTLASTGGVYFDYPFWGAFGGQLMNSSGFCIADAGGFAPALQYLKTLKAAGAELQMDYTQAANGFSGGDYSMTINGPWALPEFKTALGANLGAAVLPAGPSAALAQPMVGIDGFYINPNKVAKAATLVSLALQMTNQSAAQIWMDTGGHVPVRSDVTISDPLIQSLADAADQGQPRSQLAQLDNYWAPFQNAIDGTLNGLVTPSAAISSACREMNELNGFTVSQTFTSNGAHDGSVVENKETGGVGGALIPPVSDKTLYVGDDNLDRQYVGILSFNTASLPDNAVITSLKLRVKRQGVVGSPLFTPFGGLRVDIRKNYFGAGLGLAVNDFQALASRSLVGSFGSTLSSGWYMATLSNTAYTHVHRAGYTQIRLRFFKDDDDDMSADILKIFSGNDVVGNRPQLIIQYHLP